MTDRESQIAHMTGRIGKAIAEAFQDASLEGPPMGFMLWIFDFQEDPFLAAVSNEFSNARRPELIRLMKAHLSRLEAEEAAEKRGGQH